MVTLTLCKHCAVPVQMVSTAGVLMWMHKSDLSNLHYIVCRRPQTVATPLPPLDGYTACEGVSDGE